MHYLRLAVWPGPPVPSTTRSVWAGRPDRSRTCGPRCSWWPELLRLTAWAWRRRPALGFVGVWFFLILAPTSSFVPLEDLVFEHRMYLPLAAVIVRRGGACATRAWSGSPATGRWRWLGRRGSSPLGLVLALVAATTRRNLDYRSPLSIWQDTVAKAPGESESPPWPWASRSRTAGAARRRWPITRKPCASRRTTPEAHNNLGLALAGQGR